MCRSRVPPSHRLSNTKGVSRGRSLLTSASGSGRSESGGTLWVADQDGESVGVLQPQFPRPGMLSRLDDILVDLAHDAGDGDLIPLAEPGGPLTVAQRRGALPHRKVALEPRELQAEQRKVEVRVAGRDGVK